MTRSKATTAGVGPSSPRSFERARAPGLPLVVVTLLGLLASTAAAQEAPPAVVNGDAPQRFDDGSPTERYRRGVASFDYGDCASATTALEDIAVPGILGDEKQLVDSYRILGVCYFQAGRTTDAVRTLEALLYIDPAYQLDPFRTPPPVTELFEERKRVIRQKLEQIEEEKRRQEPEAAPHTVVIERERVMRETPFATVFLPFGAAQYVNGEGGKGALIGGIQGLSLVANLVASIAALGIDMSDQKLRSAPHDDVVQSQAFTIAWAASAVALSAFVLSYAYGVADAWWNRVPEREVSATEEHQRVEGEEAKRLLRRLDGAE